MSLVFKHDKCYLFELEITRLKKRIEELEDIVKAYENTLDENYILKSSQHGKQNIAPEDYLESNKDRL